MGMTVLLMLEQVVNPKAGMSMPSVSPNQNNIFALLDVIPAYLSM